jgi:glycosyltransferase involved in cell wall biosynthesis
MSDIAPPTLLCSVTFPSNTGFAWDSIERTYARMADILAAKGIRTFVAYPAIDNPPLTLAGSSAIPIVLDTELRNRDARAKLAEFVRRENVQVVYFSDRELWNPWYVRLRRAGARRIVVHDHTSGDRTVPTGLYAAVKRFVVNREGYAADVIVGVSNYVVERDKAASLISPHRFRRIWNGIVAPNAEIPHPTLRERLGIASDVPLIGCGCRAVREKGVDVLLRAFAQLKTKEPALPHLVYIGSGPYLEEMKKLRDRLGCGERIHLLGYLPFAGDLLRDADLCVVPSVWQEAFGLACLEMLMRGKAVIASRAGGIPEIIEENVSGILVEPADVEELARAIDATLADRALRRRLGDAGRRRALEHFTIDAQVSQMIETFADVF